MEEKEKRVTSLNTYTRVIILEHLEQQEHVDIVNNTFFTQGSYYHQDVGSLLKIEKTSPLYIFVLLGAIPRKEYGDNHTQDNFIFTTIDDPKKIYRLKTHESLLRYAVGNMLRLINLASFIYGSMKKGTREKNKSRKEIIRLLVIAAFTEYENMYSSKAKHVFAYHLRRFGENHKDLSVRIKACNTNTGKSENAKKLKKLKEEIDSTLSSGNVMPTFYISNVAITSGKIADERMSDKNEQYFIEIGVIHPSSTLKVPKYDRIFISTFK